MGDRLQNWLAEARRRRVFRTTGVYLVGVWAISQGAVELAPLFGASDWMLRAGLITAVGLTPIVVLLAWMFDIGRDGIVRDPQDVEATRISDELSQMPTQIGTDSSKGAVIVRWQDGDGEQSVAFVEDFFLGRASDCRVRFYDPLVSRKHARIFHANGDWQIEDLGSRNGTRIDGRSIEREPLVKASAIRLNEAGPELRLSLIRPGEDTTIALSETPEGRSVAHVRSTKGARTEAGTGAKTKSRGESKSAERGAGTLES